MTHSFIVRIDGEERPYVFTSLFEVVRWLMKTKMPNLSRPDVLDLREILAGEAEAHSRFFDHDGGWNTALFTWGTIERAKTP